jgi:hypothetical protein
MKDWSELRLARRLMNSHHQFVTEIKFSVTITFVRAESPNFEATY